MPKLPIVHQMTQMAHSKATNIPLQLDKQWK